MYQVIAAPLFLTGGEPDLNASLLSLDRDSGLEDRIALVKQDRLTPVGSGYDLTTDEMRCD
jgi:hypothetical protein